MKYFYSATVNGFFAEDSAMPSDAKEIAFNVYKSLIGKHVVTGPEGNPVVYAPPLPTLDDLKAAKFEIINTDFTHAAAALTAGYPPAERLTWPVQQQEAIAWAADSSAPTPYLDGLALARGIPPDEMRQKTVEQTQLFMQASQQLVGTRQRLRDLVYEATTPEALDSINWPGSPVTQ